MRLIGLWEECSTQGKLEIEGVTDMEGGMQLIGLWLECSTQGKLEKIWRE